MLSGKSFVHLSTCVLKFKPSYIVRKFINVEKITLCVQPDITNDQYEEK